MAKLLQIDFKFKGPFGNEMSEALKEIANSIPNEPGFIWKIWTESEKESEAGGIYLFKDYETAEAYLKMHTERLKSFGIEEVNGKIFDVNERLSEITKGPIS